MTFKTLKFALGFGLAGVAACGSDAASENTRAHDSDIAISALENPIIACQTQAGQCLQSATDVTSAQACQTSFGTCLQDASTKAQAIAMGIATCRDDEQKCVLAGGAQGASACVTTYESCVQALLPPSGTAPGAGFPSLPTGDAGLPTLGGGLPGFDAGLPTLGGGLPSFDAGLPTLGGGLPTLPSFDAGLPTLGGGLPTLPGFDAGLPTLGGGLPTLPGASLPGAGAGLPALPGSTCLTTLQQCATQPAADVNKCADDARTCLQSSVTFP